jgi:pyruvate/2-oxoglutarate dehydrogenase complex dihydrolipoamide acyltransferase (E2) component
MRSNAGFRVTRFPLNRRMIVDAGRHSRRQSLVHGFTEFDVTPVRELIRSHRACTGEQLSLTAYVVSCLARAVAFDPTVQAYRTWFNRVVIFEDVDVSVVLEVKQGERTFPVVHVIRAAQRRGFREVHEEIRAVQTRPASSRTFSQSRLMRRFLALPTFLRDCLYFFILRSPHTWKRQGGTVGVTSLGMFFAGGGWGLPITNYTLSICIGGIATRPAYVGTELRPREFLAVTLSINHDLVDGAPAARFLRRFRELVESTSPFDAPNPAGA